ncbi:hypothetical protein ASPSYDRAFT_78137 [Aspergillus sydowii CBS 593.65]|uniref:amidase n=1 Tax=Aspergillus sydowii CBS 593.65 TaxID=1036612 RepID=A0A1L9TK52_9EURO|nr:uncharacterized protein ASPSYDRAFT_78137 [Aspergillus sydowii CBS 593.65]OJJ59809.1 hypothetical protein ASPSYDRAFT_78137 [Aspergillus sydowii CBS 593.65]
MQVRVRGRRGYTWPGLTTQETTAAGIPVKAIQWRIRSLIRTRHLAAGKLTSVTVTTAFCKRAAIAHQLTNCLHEFFPEMALARAQYLDDYMAEHKKPKGPLHGLPISLKDQVRIKGLETTMGYAAWIGREDAEDSVLTTLLFNAGAVLYVKTSVPQALMVGETINNIFGRTTNPRNRNLSCGGSSGGEGAILAMRGSVLGVGTDIGGSIRIPAAFNFLYGLRPSHGRIPYANMANSMEGQETVHSVCGPLAHSVADMRLFVTSVLAQEPWSYDSKDEEDAIKTKIGAGGLALGYYSCDGNVLPHPPVLRAIQTVTTKLSEAGHTVLPWEPYEHSSAIDLFMSIIGADGGTDLLSTLNASGEPLIQNIADLTPTTPSKKLTINELWDLQVQKWNYQCAYLSKIRQFEQKVGKELDAIIAPVAPHAAIRHDQFKYYGYTTVVNLLDFTSVVVPVILADRDVDAVGDEEFRPLSETDEVVHGEYDPDAYHGAPVAVQIIGRRLTEERVMAIAEEVGRLLGLEVNP